MTFRHFIWDFDGTLFDTYPRMCLAFSMALKEQDCSADDGEILRRIKISTRYATGYFSERYALNEAKLREDYLSTERRLPVDGVRPYGGMDRLLDGVVLRGGRNYLYTHRDRSALAFLAAFGLDKLFSGFVTAEDAFAPKPAPDALNYIVDHWRIPPESAVMIGDRDIDMLCAREAGLGACLFDPDHYYDGFSADLRADSVAALGEILLA